MARNSLNWRAKLRAACLIVSACATVPAASAAAEPCPTGLIDGKHVTILTAGRDTGDASDVVLIPGLSTPRAVWDATAADLAATHRLHLVQFRGFGDAAGANADGPILVPAMREIADYIDDCITDQGRPAPAVIGHSAGGLIGLMIAAQAPQEIGRLMIVDALPFIGTLFAPGATVEMMRPQAEAMAGAMRAQAVTDPATITDPGPSSMLARMSNTAAGRVQVARWTAQADLAVSAQLLLDVMTTDMRSDLAAVHIPLTLVYAQDDVVMPADRTAAIFAGAYQAVPNFTDEPIAPSRHFIMLDQPAQFARAVFRFLAR